MNTGHRSDIVIFDDHDLPRPEVKICGEPFGNCPNGHGPMEASPDSFYNPGGAWRASFTCKVCGLRYAGCGTANIPGSIYDRLREWEEKK